MFTDNLIKAEPYTAGEQPDKKDFIKLNANENPYPPAPEVSEVISGFSGSSLSRYPNADAKELSEAIGKFIGVPGKNVFCGNGSDDVLALCFRAFFNSSKPILFADVTYSFYPVWCEMFGIPYETMPLDENMQYVASDYYKDNGGVVICNPNAPTSIARGLDFIEDILEHNKDRVVIVDEAYVEFGAETCLPLLEKYENLCVVTTFSKSRSMAGMRIGYAVCGDTLMHALRAAKDCYNSYPLDSVSIAAGIASVGNEKYFRDTLGKVMDTRDRTKERLRAMGFEVADSCTNFLFAHHPSYTAPQIYDHLKARDIYVRFFNKPRINDHLRITIGTDEQMDPMIKALEELIK